MSFKYITRNLYNIVYNIIRKQNIIYIFKDIKKYIVAYIQFKNIIVPPYSLVSL